jgi:hypothetical protein
MYRRCNEISISHFFYWDWDSKAFLFNLQSIYSGFLVFLTKIQRVPCKGDIILPEIGRHWYIIVMISDLKKFLKLKNHRKTKIRKRVYRKNSKSPEKQLIIKKMKIRNCNTKKFLVFCLIIPIPIHKSMKELDF